MILQKEAFIFLHAYVVGFSGIKLFIESVVGEYSEY